MKAEPLQRLNKENLWLLIVVLEKIAGNILDQKKNKSFNIRLNKLDLFIGNTNNEAKVKFGHLVQKQKFL